MALIDRNIVGTIEKPDGSKWAGGTVGFTIAATQADGSIVVPKITVEVTTDTNGEFTAPLKTLAGSYINYEVQLPNKKVHTVSLTDDDGDADLSDLLQIAASAPEIALRVASETDLGAVRIDGTSIIIDEDGVISAVGGGGGAVASVNAQTGAVVLDADDISDTSTTNKFTTAVEKTKLAGIATGATANDTDANLKARANHTGTQPASTISDFAATVLATVLTGLSTATNAAISATDTVLSALGKLQAQVSSRLAIANNLSDLNNAATARTNLGLGNVNNTSDLSKPISTATQLALNDKLNASDNLADLTDVSAARINLSVPADADVVHDTGDETIEGIKEFIASPIVPTPTQATDAANKQYVDDNAGGLTGVTNPASGQLKFEPASGVYAIDIDRTSNSGDQKGIRIVSGDGANLSANKALYILNAAEDRGVTHSYESSSSYVAQVDSSSYRVATSGGVGGRDIRLQPGNVDRFILPVKKDLTDNATTSLYEIALPTLTGTGGVLKATVFASDGTDVQSRSQIVRYSAVNKAGTYTTEIVVVSEAVSASTGTLTGTWSILTGSNKITIQFNGNSSLTPTTLWIHYTIESFSDQAITLL